MGMGAGSGVARSQKPEELSYLYLHSTSAGVLEVSLGVVVDVQDRRVERPYSPQLTILIENYNTNKQFYRLIVPSNFYLLCLVIRIRRCVS